jgi:LmbE family N-acetylglucosaminyl deacetylase
LTEGEIAPRRIDQLLYRMRGLRIIGNVLHVGAHPDDEDAGLIAYISHKYSARTVYWSATRGEGGQELVREVVRAIRLVQPQVLIARFTGEPSDGHGQHQAVGSATLEAFDAAADATLFPELGLPPWETPKLYRSTGGDWQPGEKTALGKLRPECEPDSFLRIDTGELDPIVGLTYQQQAWIAFPIREPRGGGTLVRT